MKASPFSKLPATDYHKQYYIDQGSPNFFVRGPNKIKKDLTDQNVRTHIIYNFIQIFIYLQIYEE